MRNYVFISNKGAQDIIEEHLSEYHIPRASLEISKNAKGKVIHFYNSHWAKRLSDFVADQRNTITYELTVMALSQDEKRKALETLRSLTRINDELNFIIKQFNEKRMANL
jgi:signal-transduction protein with cAMP-binding, CBS, and nucleotidyltransferase domain